MTNQSKDKPIVHIVNWFEIPVADLAKASAFYGAMLDCKLNLTDFGGVPHAIFATTDPRAVGGALICDPRRRAMHGGTTLYLHATDGVARCLSRAVEAGAKVIQPVTPIDPHGTIALIEDLDGNVVGLHEPPKS